MLFSGSPPGLGGAKLHSPFLSSFPKGKTIFMSFASFWLATTRLDAMVSLPIPLVTTATRSPMTVGAVAADWPFAMGRMTQESSRESFLVAGSHQARCTIVSMET